MKIEPIWQNMQNLRSMFIWPIERGSGPKVVRAALDTDRVVLAEQVHSTQVTVVGDLTPSLAPGVDGLVTSQPGIALAVAGADCQVILAVDPTVPVVGIVHAGWKGTLAVIAAALIKTLESQGASLDRIKMHIGPSIGPCHYSVDQPDREPRFATFLRRFGPEVAFERGGEKVVDLRAAQRQQFLAAGILPEHLTIDPRCTFCALDRFPSHRREGESRHQNLIGCIALA